MSPSARQPRLPEPFALISIFFAVLGLLSFAPMSLAAAGYAQGEGVLDVVARQIGAAHATGALSGALAAIAGLFGLAFRSERVARIGMLIGLALVVVFVVLPFGFLVWEVYKCASGNGSCD